jgi:hypothetical protein
MSYRDEIEALLPTTQEQVQANPALVPQALAELRQAVLAIAERLGGQAQGEGDDQGQWIR